MKARARKTREGQAPTADVETHGTRRYIDPSLADQPLDPKVKREILSEVERMLDTIGSRACLSCIELSTDQWFSPPNPYLVYRLQVAFRRAGI
jgi:hypothetical protein